MTDKKFNMADLTTSLLTGAPSPLPQLTGQPVAGQQEAEAPAPAPLVSEAPERRRPQVWRTLQTPEGIRPSPRQQQRDARALAEAWLQALRTWEVQTSSELVPRTTGGGSSGRMTVIMGNYGRGGATLDFRRVHTPLGWVAESAVVRHCTADPLLSEIQEGRGLATLVHASGRGWAGQRAREYAAGLLALAHNLGDPKAADLLHLAFAEDRDTLSVELDQ